MVYRTSCSCLAQGCTNHRRQCRCK